MISSNSDPFQGQELKFPVDWTYRIIVSSEEKESALAEIKEILAKHAIESPVEEGRGSSKGRFSSLRVKVHFEDKVSMELLSTELSQVKHVKFLL
ncbi:MAG: hypothetical protein A2020_09270 [Lentisphaerae bacterium GWF2_45_14]|nr:MAG: hypothetical protein A2020_09270 [Lentisphaerae bacterium GWF2_45_14]